MNINAYQWALRYQWFYLVSFEIFLHRKEEFIQLFQHIRAIKFKITSYENGIAQWGLFNKNVNILMVCGSINHIIYFFSIFSVFVLKVSRLWFAIDVRFQLQKHLPTGANVDRYESYLRESGGKTQVLASNPIITKGVMDVVSSLQCIYHSVRYNATIPYFIVVHVVHDLVQISSVSRYITNIGCHCTHWYQSWPRFYKATVIIWKLFHLSHYMDQNAIKYLVIFLLYFACYVCESLKQNISYCQLQERFLCHNVFSNHQENRCSVTTVGSYLCSKVNENVDICHMRAAVKDR